MFNKVLIANRGTIACRIIRTLRRMGVGSVAVYSDADLGSLHVRAADEAIRLGPAPAVHSYLDVDAIIAAAHRTGATAIHPGYGFLSENAQFAQACQESQLTFIGPTPDNIRAFGLKHTARELAREAGLPLMPGSELLSDAHAAVAEAERISYPVMLKATAGGGGIGMRICEDADAIREAFASIVRLAGSNFADGGVYLERFVRLARHIEVQIFGDGAGRVVALGERDCSLQRRNQKVMEEAPAPHLAAATRAALRDAALRLGSAAHYRSAGTVEFLYDPLREQFYFLEVNTRLQVEHGVTEQITGVDLVEWMIRGAAGDMKFLDTWTGATAGASIQARIYAEDPDQDFRPCSGVLTQVKFAPDARVETWVTDGSEVSTWYDPLLAKLIVTARDRDAAVLAMQAALDHTGLHGLETNIEWLRRAARSEAFVSGHVSTSMAQSIEFAPQTIRVLSGGLATTVQDHPGRQGYWNVGVPPSGPMDALSFRTGNRLLGNAADAAGLEITAQGPTLLFRRAARICLSGARLDATLDGVAVAAYSPLPVRAGQTLKLGRVRGAGMRAYLLLAGGLDVPRYLGSRATFTLGRFGGHAGRTLAAGDVLRLCESRTTGAASALQLPDCLMQMSHEWPLRVLYGPHGAPDFFAPEDIEMLQSTSWKVHYNSSRTGVRLIGPRPKWARRDGGEAGLHPSNIHDNAYAIGTIDFTGDMPIILGPDGPSLGGFVCPLVVIQADLWKVGQLAPGDSVRFDLVSDAQAQAAEEAMEALLTDSPPAPARSAAPGADPHSPILGSTGAHGQRPQVVYRRQGDRHILVEYGPLVLDLTLRIRIHALMLELQRRALPAVIDITPGIRSLQVHFDSRRLTQAALLQTLADAEDQIGDLTDFSIPSRVIHLPLSWGDPAIHETIEKYLASVRSDAPWCPDNIEFIRRINGLASVEAVRDIVFDARYLVMGLGDVYLGAPVATPLDPRHRLVTTKYNPARTWTPPNVVGIGGAYLCIYGMEGPGGYQLFGRTLQVWNTWQQTQAFTEDKPWLLRFFDQIRFFPVSHAELTEWRRDFPLGRRDVRIETETFSLAAYRRFLDGNATAIGKFQTARQAAFEAERDAWVRNHEFSRVAALLQEPTELAQVAATIPAGSEVLEAPLGGNVWKINVRPGDRVARGTVIAVIEAMKMECDVPAPQAGIVRAVYVQPRQSINPGAPIIALEAQGQEA
jgi:urea carboxylase